VILLVIVRGLRGVAKLMQWIVPLMAALGATSLLIGLWHITALPTIFESIFRSAFGWQEAAAGAVGYTISQALTSGFQRGMFSNEAGWGQRLTPPRPRLPGPAPGGAGDRADDWRLYRYHRDLYRQRRHIMLAPRTTRKMPRMVFRASSTR
jgi:AGCS family alanine or glycine:cation symporter